MRIISFILLIIFTNTTLAQERFCSIQINKAALLPNDTLEILANYVNDYNTNTEGVLCLKVINEKGKIWNYRWPIYNGLCNPKIIIPTDAAAGIHHFYFATRNDQFTAIGNLKNNNKKFNLSATLVNKDNLIITNNIAIDKNNDFTYTNPYFIDNAILFFKNDNKKSLKPTIQLVTNLDSNFIPTTEKYIAITVGTVTNSAKPSKIPKKYNDIDLFYAPKVKVEEMVTVKQVRKLQVKDFEDKYIGDLFKETGEKTLNLLDDDPGKYGQDLFSYLQSNVPAIRLERNDSTNVKLLLRGNDVTYYLDQIVIPEEYAAFIDVNNIAIIKIFNPPFFGNVEANTGAIALFSKKTSNFNSKNSFTVKGYSAPIVKLH